MIQNFKHISLWVVVLAIAGCLEVKEGEPSGQIVVIGNGVDWSKAVVVDVRHGNTSESFALESGNPELKEIAPLLGANPEFKKADYVAVDLAGESLIQLSAIETEEVEKVCAPAFTLENSVVPEKSAPETQVFSQSTTEGAPQRKEELEELKISPERAPLFLDATRVIFMDEAKSLQYFDGDKLHKILDEKFGKFYFQAPHYLFVEMSPNTWRLLKLPALEKNKESSPSTMVLSPVEFKVDHLFQKAGETWVIDLKKQEFLKWNPDTASFLRDAALPQDVTIQKFHPAAENHWLNNHLVIEADIFRSPESERSVRALLVISEKDVKILKTFPRVFNDGGVPIERKVAVAGDRVGILTPGVGLEICSIRSSKCENQIFEASVIKDIISGAAADLVISTEVVAETSTADNHCSSDLPEIQSSLWRSSIDSAGKEVREEIPVDGKIEKLSRVIQFEIPKVAENSHPSDGKKVEEESSDPL